MPTHGPHHVAQKSINYGFAGLDDFIDVFVGKCKMPLF